MKNKKLLFGIVAALMAVILSVAFTGCENSNKSSSILSDEELANKCIELLETENYDEIIEYFPKVLYSDFDFSKFKSANEFYISTDEIYNHMQNKYLFAYLYTEQYDKFKQEFINHFSDYKLDSSDSIFMYITGVAYSDISEEQKNAIVDTLTENIQYIGDDKTDLLYKIGTYNTLASISEYYGDSENEEYYLNKSNEVLEQLKN